MILAEKKLRSKQAMFHFSWEASRRSFFFFCFFCSSSKTHTICSFFSLEKLHDNKKKRLKISILLQVQVLKSENILFFLPNCSLSIFPRLYQLNSNTVHPIWKLKWSNNLQFKIRCRFSSCLTDPGYILRYPEKNNYR